MATSLLVFGLSRHPDSKLVGKGRRDMLVRRVDDDFDLAQPSLQSPGEHIVGVLGPQLEAPLATAERLASTYPGVDVVVVRPRAEVSGLRHMLSTHPRLASRTVVISEGEVMRLPSILDGFVAAQRRAARYHETVRRFNAQIGVPRPMALDRSAFLDLVLEHAPVGVILLGPDNGIVNANPEARRLLGGNVARQLSEALEHYLPEAERERLRHLIGRARTEPEARQSAVFAVDPTAADGRHLSFTATPGPDAGHAEGVLVLLQDVTEEVRLREMHRAAEKRALEAQYAAEQANHAKTQFLANVSHELRTPMNAIIGFSEFIGMRLAPSEENRKIIEYASIIHKAARHLSSLLEDVMDVSSIELGYTRITQAEFMLWEVVRDVIDVLEERARSEGVTINAELVGGAVETFADEKAVRQITMNLLSNALKFTPAGGRVDVLVDIDEAGLARLTVRDTGIGIAEADLERILMPFERADNARSEETPGTGLGLHLVNVLTRLNGGVLDIASELGVGTTVTVLLPLAGD